jgi:hypothetical protein
MFPLQPLKFILHSAIALFSLFGWLLFPRIHGPYCGAVLLHWLTNNNRCFLSGEYEDPNGFTKDFLGAFGIGWPRDVVAQNVVVYAMLIVPMLLSVFVTNM